MSFAGTVLVERLPPPTACKTTLRDDRVLQINLGRTTFDPSKRL